MASRQEFEALARHRGKSVVRSTINGNVYLVPSTQDMWEAYALGAGIKLSDLDKDADALAKWVDVGYSPVPPSIIDDNLTGYVLPTRAQVDAAVNKRELMPGNYWLADGSLYQCGALIVRMPGANVWLIRRGA